MKRRDVIVAVPALGGLVGLAPTARATPSSLAAAISAFTAGALVREGRVTLDIPLLVENGNAVPVTLAAEGFAVRRLALFTEQNPQPEVAVFSFGPLAGRASVATRMRLATSQTVVAMAELADGSFWQQRVAVVVTLAACVEGG